MGGDACDLVSTVNRVRATDAENHPRVKLQNGDFRDDEVVHDDDEDEVNKNRKYVPFTHYNTNLANLSHTRLVCMLSVLLRQTPGRPGDHRCRH